MNKIFLIEDHNEALRVWRENNVKGFDLVHIDAHIDFGFYQAKPVEQVMKEAKTLEELKNGLEQGLSFQRYESDFEKQVNIGNYIYPAMREGIINDFYWVVPGIGRTPGAALRTQKQLSNRLFGRRFIICTLEELPVLKQKILLDIDTDFLVIDSLLTANNTAKIGKRKPWIMPKDLVEALKEKIKQPQIITIAYSVNGGYTPMKYKHLGDEIAYHFSPGDFSRRYDNNSKAAKYFDLFCLTNKKEYYQRAVKLNPTYRVMDNNYAPLYLALRKFSQAKKEFLKITKVDPQNPYPFMGLGSVALEKRDFGKAKGLFSCALRYKNDLSSSLFGLAQAEFGLENFNKAKKLFLRYQALEPLQPGSYYFLGRIYERKRNFQKAATYYQDAMRLGLNNIDLISRLLKISCYIKQQYDIIKLIRIRYAEFKKGFKKVKRLNLKEGEKTKGLEKIKKKMLVFETRLKANKGGISQ